jgi:hypothetical protein
MTMTPPLALLGALSALALASACGRAVDLPDPPPPLDQAAPSPASAPVGGAIALRGALVVTAELIQTAADAPPVRLRVRAEVSLPAQGAPALTAVEVTPATLADRAGLTVGPARPDRWPLTALWALQDAAELARWLQTPPNAGACAAAAVAPPGLQVTRSDGAAGGSELRWSTAAPTGEHRGEAAGQLTLDAAGTVSAGRVRLRRWTRFEGDCRMVQREDITIEPR